MHVQLGARPRWQTRPRGGALLATREPGAEGMSPVGGIWQVVQLSLQVTEVDGLGEELKGSKFPRSASTLVIAIGGHHDHGQIRPPLFDLIKQSQPIHARHVDV
jgi:hypothetical protein